MRVVLSHSSGDAYNLRLLDTSAYKLISSNILLGKKKALKRQKKFSSKVPANVIEELCSS